MPFFVWIDAYFFHFFRALGRSDIEDREALPCSQSSNSGDRTSSNREERRRNQTFRFQEPTQISRYNLK